MNFVIQIDNTITKDIIILRACSRNKNYIHSVILYLQKDSSRIKVYDELHNLYLITRHEIYYIKNIDHKVYIYTEKDAYHYYLQFSRLKKQLRNCDSCQMSQNTLVNSIHIKSIRIEKDCHWNMTLDNEECLIVNRRYRSSLKGQA